MYLRFIAFFMCMIGATIGHAQFPVVGTLPFRSSPLYSLNAGHKLITPIIDQTSAHIYNLDLSLHRTLSLPPLAPNESYSGITSITVTEALFDQDPTNIEYLVSYVSEQSIFGGYQGVKVCREDGSVLLDVINVMIHGVFMAEGQAYMVLADMPPAAPPLGSTVYALPGRLACTDCLGFPWTSDGSVGTPPTVDLSTALVLAPNPASDEVWIRSMDGITNIGGLVQVFDGGGRMVLERSFQASDRLKVNVSSLPMGTYHAIVTMDGRSATRLPFQVIR